MYSIHNGLYPPSYLCHYEVDFAHSEDEVSELED